MKKLLIIIAAAALLGGCASSMPMGALYTNLALPVTATSNSGNTGLKTGTAQCKSYLGMVAVGDCSIEAAKLNGGISNVTSVDWKASSILGLIGNYEVTVKGN